MTDGDSELSHSEEAEWDAIVASEWPIESAILTTRLSGTSTSPDRTAGTAERLFVTMYQPRRPSLTPLALCALALASSAWLTIQILDPTYQQAILAGISRPERAVEVHDLTVAGVLVAIALVAAASSFGVWATATAQFRLRRSSCRLVGCQSTPATKYVRPPNPATAATWVLLLLSVSAAAAWWIPLQLQATTGSRSHAVEALRLAAVGATTWLGVFLLCGIGLTTWVARESRNRVRCNAMSSRRDRNSNSDSPTNVDTIGPES